MDSDIKKMLTRHEGKRLMPYVDTKGKVTIGIGHNLTDDGLKEKFVDAIFEDDLADTKKWVIEHISFFDKLTPNRQNVILDMAFNLRDKLLGFKKFLFYMSSGQYASAASELMNSAFAEQTGTRAKELHDMLL